MKKIIWASLVCLALVSPSSGHAETIWVATTGNQLLSFDSGSPGSITNSLPVTGLPGGETVEGIDFRPLNGMLYALGSTGRLYTIDLETGAATQVGASFTLTGTRFGFDFNPTVDRIRAVSDQEQNLRLHPDTGVVAFTDPALAFAVGDVNSGDDPVVAGAGYTNSLAGVSTTVLYDIELGNDVLVSQNPANDGTLNTIGPLGVAAVDSFVGFDISGRTGTAYAAINPGSGPTLYRIDLSTGTALRVGAIGGSASGITGLAIAASEGTCVPSTTALCLSGDRFRVSAVWTLPDGSEGAAQAIPLNGGTSGYFYFFTPDNIELDVKVLNACSQFDRFWVFASGLTNVGVTLTVVDTATNDTKVYVNPVNRAFVPIQDTDAFDTCN